jgi:hypothetical protein
MASSQPLSAAEQATFPVILRTVVGSEVAGTGLPGVGDVDHVGIAVEAVEDVLGVGVSPELWEFRTAWERPAPAGFDPRSGAGDLDLSVYPARKWCRLALAGNPSVLVPLFVPNEFVVSATTFGEELRENRNKFVSQQLGRKHLGYMNAQRQRLEGSTGGMRVTRQDLIDSHGYDTKYASHVLRLGHQGLIVLTEGTLPVPLPTDIAETILAVRRGERELTDVLEEADRLVEAMIDALETTTVPEHGDVSWVNGWLARTQLGTWSG